MVAVLESDSMWIAPPFPTVTTLFSNVALLTFKVPLLSQIPPNLAVLSDSVELITFTAPLSIYKNKGLWQNFCHSPLFLINGVKEVASKIRS